MDREQIIRRFVEGYGIEVPAERVENELNYIRQEMKHRMRYDTLTGGSAHLFPERELAEQRDELFAAAFYEAKYDLVIKDIIDRQQFPVTQEELEAEAEAIARRQSSTVEMVKRFFGEDLKMLERDIRIRKAEDWICGQA